MLTRRQRNERAFKAERRKLRLSKGIWPVVDEEYKEWIRHLPCLVTLSRTYGIRDPKKLVGLAILKSTTQRAAECAHVGDNKGMAQKCGDRETIPLSAHFHRTGPHSHHVLTPGPAFFAYHGLDRDAIISELNAKYEEMKQQ